ncbi:thiaminase II [Mycobacterium sp. MS1601]|uniref:thiaminase II n=1 Tax=Mycobacterium sp. MS1601 TaxID=1936029 RepID=UPI001F032708|nr:thiaminase II [Mycobacterium sp. MS1601]
MTAPNHNSWSAQLWREITPIFDAIVAHPFLTGLTDGSLEPDVFAHYVAQDVHYLRDYARTLALIGAKSPTLVDTAMFAKHAAGVVDDELALHASLLPELGLDPADIAATPVAPTTLAYTSYLLATTYDGSFADGLAAILPCYWIYLEVGRHLVKQGSPDPRFQRWIDTYAGDDFAAAVGEVLELTDRVGATLTPDAEVRARMHFTTTARYEWMFFDASFRRETWPV